MAKATLRDRGIDWDSYVADYDRIRDKIEAVFPELFAHFNNLIRRPGGFHRTISPRSGLQPGNAAARDIEKPRSVQYDNLWPRRPMAQRLLADRRTHLGRGGPRRVQLRRCNTCRLMAKPDDLVDFAVGFSYTEGIITAPAEIAELAVVSVADGMVLRMWLTGDRSDAFAARRRRFVGPAGCGMCGLESLAEANRAIPIASRYLQASQQDIAEAVAALPARQQLNMQTRAVHAAAFWRPGRSVVLREDVGRHNALDKLAGALLRTGSSAAEGIVVLTSRISIGSCKKPA